MPSVINYEKLPSEHTNGEDFHTFFTQFSCKTTRAYAGEVGPHFQAGSSIGAGVRHAGGDGRLTVSALESCRAETVVSIPRVALEAGRTILAGLEVTGSLFYIEKVGKEVLNYKLLWIMRILVPMKWENVGEMY